MLTTKNAQDGPSRVQRPDGSAQVDLGTWIPCSGGVVVWTEGNPLSRSQIALQDTLLATPVTDHGPLSPDLKDDVMAGLYEVCLYYPDLHQRGENLRVFTAGNARQGVPRLASETLAVERVSILEMTKDFEIAERLT